MWPLRAYRPPLVQGATSRPSIKNQPHGPNKAFEEITPRFQRGILQIWYCRFPLVGYFFGAAPVFNAPGSRIRFVKACSSDATQ
jgi:hypothetical protein